MQKPGRGFAGGMLIGRQRAGPDILEGVYSTLFLGYQKSGKFQLQSGMRQQ